jgi:RNA polymerase sigma-70 factor (ECF subfamily)
MTGSEPAQKIRHVEAEERRLVEAARRDPARFADLYESFFELVYAYVVRRVQSRAEAEDLTAEVFHRALRSLPRFKWTGAPFASWLFRIAANMIADRAKRAAREQGAGVFEETATDAGQAQIDFEALERHARLFRLVEALAEDQRRVVLMRFVEEKSIREISQTLQRSEGAIKQLQFRALQNLRKEIIPEDTKKRSAES